MTEEPRPASLENTPRLQPWVMTSRIATPAAPPATPYLTDGLPNFAAPVDGLLAAEPYRHPAIDGARTQAFAAFVIVSAALFVAGFA